MTRDDFPGTFPVTLLYDPGDGSSRWATLQLPATRSIYGLSSDPIPASSVSFRNTDGGPSDVDFHPAPRRQVVITVIGRIAYTNSEREEREFGPGDILVFADTTGVGHSAQVLQSPRIQAFVPLADEFDLLQFAVEP